MLHSSKKVSNLLQLQGGKIGQNSASADALVWVSHGYGASRESLREIILPISSHCPNLRFVLPNGIQPYEGGGFGYQWFSLKDFTQQAMQRELSTVASRISSWINETLDVLKINQLYLVGFSQGAMLSLYLAASGLLSPKKILSYSGLFVPPSQVNTADKNSEILAVHGDMDQVLPLEMTKKSYDLLSKYNLKEKRLIVERGVGHYITAAGVTAGINFLI